MMELKTLTRNGICRQSFASEQGATLVELALTCTLLFSMLFGLMEMGFGLYTYNAVANAARQGSRWAIVRGAECSTNTPNQTYCNASQTDIQNYVASLGYLNIAASNTTASWLSATTSGTPATTTWSACATPCKAPGNEVQVTVTYPFPLSVPFVPKSTLSLTSTSTLVISQ
jgi:Flp pilus assembly protein TadG